MTDKENIEELNKYFIDETFGKIEIDIDEEDDFLSDRAYEFYVDFIRTVDWSFLLPNVEENRFYIRNYRRALTSAVRDYCESSDFYCKIAPLFNEYVKSKNVCFTVTRQNKWTKKFEKKLFDNDGMIFKLCEFENEIAFEILKSSNVSDEVLAKGKKVFNINY